MEIRRDPTPGSSADGPPPKRSKTSSSGTKEEPIDLDVVPIVDLDDESESESEVEELYATEIVDIPSDEDEEQQIVINSDEEGSPLSRTESGESEENRDDEWYYWSPAIMKTFSEFLISVGHKHTDDSNTRFTWDGCFIVRNHLRKHHPHDLIPDAVTNEMIEKNLERLHAYYLGYLTLLGCGWLAYVNKMKCFEPLDKKMDAEELLGDIKAYLKDNGVNTSIIDAFFYFSEDLHFLTELHYFFKGEGWTRKAPVAEHTHRRRFRVPGTRDI